MLIEPVTAELCPIQARRLGIMSLSRGLVSRDERAVPRGARPCAAPARRLLSVLSIRVLVSKTDLFLSIRRVEIRVVVDLP